MLSLLCTKEILHIGDTESLELCGFQQQSKKKPPKFHASSHRYTVFIISQTLNKECGGYVGKVSGGYIEQVYGSYIRQVRGRSI